MEVTIHDTVCTVTFNKYQVNNANAIMLTEKETGEPYMTASVNMPDYIIKPDEVFIKNYSENEGILDVLINEHIVLPLLAVQPGIMKCAIIKTN